MLGGQGVRLSRAGSFTLPCPFASKQGLQKLDISAFKAGVVQKGREVRGGLQQQEQQIERCPMTFHTRME